MDLFLHTLNSKGGWVFYDDCFLLFTWDWRIYNENDKKWDKIDNKFRLESVTLFKKYRRSALCQLPINASDADILYADGATLRLDNQKNGREILCVYQDHNYDGYYSPVQVFCCRYVHNCSLSADQTTPLSVYLENDQHNYVKAENMRKNIKFLALQLEYPGAKGIPIGGIGTHSLRSGDTNVLALSGYSDREIQKMGLWRIATFMEYIRD